MPSVPETRLSLILRLPDKGDLEAWEQFLELYRPIVFRVARSRGLQSADAEELTQDVMMSVARSVQNWDPDRSKGRFRDWLFKIVRNWIIKYLTRRKHKILGTGDSGFPRFIEEHYVQDDDLEQIIELEYQREVFRWAAKQVQQQVRPETWQAFWLTSMLGLSTEEVAAKLNLSTGAVHIARSRVRGRLRERVHDFESQGSTPSIAQHESDGGQQ